MRTETGENTLVFEKHEELFDYLMYHQYFVILRSNYQLARITEYRDAYGIYDFQEISGVKSELPEQIIGFGSYFDSKEFFEALKKYPDLRIIQVWFNNNEVRSIIAHKDNKLALKHEVRVEYVNNPEIPVEVTR